MDTAFPESPAGHGVDGRSHDHRSPEASLDTVPLSLREIRALLREGGL